MYEAKKIHAKLKTSNSTIYFYKCIYTQQQNKNIYWNYKHQIKPSAHSAER